MLIYNPVNRRVPLTLAESIRNELGRCLPDLPVTLLATQRADHARELAGHVAATGAPLIVAVSGDGVYNEVVNGVLDVPDSHALAAVAAGGNANDHRRSTRRMPLVEAIASAHHTGRARFLDLLQLTARSADAGWSRYAHSYIGLGLTPSMAVGLKRDRKGTVAELLSVLRTFTELSPVEIVRSEGRRELYDSLVFANVTRMAKYGRLGGSGRPDDGLFEVVSRRHGRRWRIAAMALRAATIGLGTQAHVNRVDFATVDAINLQMDGEVLQLAPDSRLTIECAPGALATVG
ncbi:diacylglycerol/lipid kinase family protein [Microlunatus ginsengisoli]|uniref:diacylglycerol/lipid kinase family protein n=1 Tax=Microlunatus ginsengisoli TaxID=363863 RepID=UPI0031CDF75D